MLKEDSDINTIVKNTSFKMIHNNEIIGYFLSTMSQICLILIGDDTFVFERLAANILLTRVIQLPFCEPNLLSFTHKIIKFISFSQLYYFRNC